MTQMRTPLSCRGAHSSKSPLLESQTWYVMHPCPTPLWAYSWLASCATAEGPLCELCFQGDGLYPSLLHAMGAGQRHMARAAVQDHAPPRRLSSFVNHAVQEGRLPPGLKMEGGVMMEEEPGEDVPLAVPVR